MSVEIDPQELGFHRPFTVEVLENLKIRNPGTQPVAFKVKTTAPKQYCVRPNSGRVEPNREVEVQVILQAMKQEPAPGTKCRDKFLVQSVAITPEKDFSNLASIWDNIDKSLVQERKIRVSFLDPKSSPATEKTATTPSKSTPVNDGDASPEVAPPAYSPSESSAGRSDRKSSVVEKSHSDEKASFAAPVAVATTKNSEPSYEELKEQLLQAENLVAQLKNDDGGLRQRKTASTAEEKSIAKPAELAQAVRAGTEGVPVQITAVLCLLSFLLAYIFF
ncbi:putative integral ER membrane protein Scs2 [Xylaria venustula]|nr:putative integral ER membrane protein Scs2 [Xylaria venustula]